MNKNSFLIELEKIVRVVAIKRFLFSKCCSDTQELQATVLVLFFCYDL